MLQFVYSPEVMGSISAAIFRFDRGLRRKPSNWPEDVQVAFKSLTLERVQDLIKTFIDALGES
jgi:ribosome recycling factor